MGELKGVNCLTYVYERGGVREMFVVETEQYGLRKDDKPEHYQFESWIGTRRVRLFQEKADVLGRPYWVPVELDDQQKLELVIDKLVVEAADRVEFQPNRML